MTTTKKTKRGSKKAPKKLKREVERVGNQQVRISNAQKSNDGLMDIYRSILYELPEIVYKIDPEGTFTFISKAVRVLGYEPAELVGEHYSKIVHPDDVRCFGRYYILPKFI